ncbi:MAG: hypothetical protein ACFFAX_06540 [Promethearchaeota archaeon]
MNGLYGMIQYLNPQEPRNPQLILMRAAEIPDEILREIRKHFEMDLDVPPELEKSVTFRREKTIAIRMIKGVLDG